MGDNTRITITLPTELYEELRKEAYDKRTSISKVIISRLEIRNEN